MRIALGIFIAVLIVAFLLIAVTFTLENIPEKLSSRATPPHALGRSPLFEFSPKENTPPSFIPSPTAPTLNLRVKKQLAREIEEHGGSWDLLGRIDVLSADLLEMADGSLHRHSVLRSSRNEGLVLAIERFDARGDFTHATFHSAEKIMVKLPVSVPAAKFRSQLTALGMSAEPSPGWHDFVEVRVEPSPQKILESQGLLQEMVGQDGAVFLAGVMPSI